MNTSHHTHRHLSPGKVRSLIFLLVALAVFGSAIPVFRAFASNPTSGTLDGSATAPVTWNGTGTGGASESHCFY